ncbi:MAG: hypothetical protein ACPHUJ_12895 [Pseudomonadales bacterium]
MAGNTQQAEIAAAIHRAKHQGVFCVSGGGSAAIDQLLSVPSASKTVLECSIPYSAASMQAYLGRTPISAVSSETAAQMAMVAYQRANALSPETAPSNFGLSCTAALATDRIRKGSDRAYIAIQSQQSTLIQTLEFKTPKSTASLNDAQQPTLRRRQEETLSQAILSMLGEFTAASVPQEATLNDTYETSLERVDAPIGWQQIMTQIEGSTLFPKNPACIFPGAFDPPHAGHAKIRNIAENVTGRDTYFELSIHNVDKPSLDYIEISKRLDALAPFGPVVLTNAPTFVQKARLFPGAIFAVGVDTLERIDASRYYGTPAAKDAAIDELARLGVAFLVFGRLMDDRFITLEDLKLSSTLKTLCEPLSEQRFREDISSSAIRAASQAKRK